MSAAPDGLMRAVVQDRYGPPEVYRVERVARPVVGDDQLLVQVKAASVHPDVWHVLTGRPYVLRLMGAGLRRPSQPIPGTDVAGRVEAVGRAVTRFAPGDEVFGETVAGYQWSNGGAFAEYVAVPERCLARKPAGVSFEQAAAVPTSGLIVLLNLKEVPPIRPGQRVLVNGAAGGVGALALQIARARGARVTGVDLGDRLDLVRSLGADEVIDGARQDFTRSDQRWDLIFDVPGNHPFTACRRVLQPSGKYLLIGHDRFGAGGRPVFGMLPGFVGLLLRATVEPRLPRPSFAPPDKQAGMAELAGLLEAGRLTPLLDRTYPLEEAGDAMRRLESGLARGRILLAP